MKPYRQAGWKNGRPVFKRAARSLLDINNSNDHAAIGFAHGHQRPVPPLSPLEISEMSSQQLLRGADQCRAIRDGQEVYCPTCALRWSLNEDRPECPK